MPQERLENSSPQVALVTGGAVRVGRLISLGLAAGEYSVVVHYNSHVDEAKVLQRSIEAYERECLLIQGDLRDPRTADALHDAVAKRFGRLDVLVNSAAVMRRASLLDVDAQAWDDVMALNLRASHLLVRALAPLLRTANGCAINIIDLGARRPWPEYGVHSVAKGALEHLTRLQAAALAPDVRVNALLLGDVYPGAKKDKRVAWAGSSSPLGKVVAEDDVVRAVRLLIESGTSTGSTLVLDAGRSMEDGHPKAIDGDH